MGATYKVLTGIDYAGKRAEPGDLVDDLPSKSISWLREQGHIEPADADAPSEPAPTEEE
jgi:hypothetical protein